MSSFSSPPKVTCILCKASVSVKQGDKARFYSHISHDHEVHYDMELLYALSFMTDKEKETVVNIMEKREAVNGSTEPEAPKEETNEVETISLDESVILEASFMTDKEKETVAPVVITEKTEKIDTDSTETKNTEKKVAPKVKCPKCEVMVPRKTLKIHLKLKHKATNLKHSLSSCRFCDKSMRKSSLGRHLRQVHRSSMEEHIKMEMKEAGADIPATKIKMEVVNDVIQQDLGAEQTQSEKKERICKICFKSVSVKRYSRHLREKHAGISHKCKLCHIRLFRKDYVKKHIESCHKNDRHLLDDQLNPTFAKSDCKFDCKECGLKLITGEVLEYHTARSHGTGSQKCDNCNRRFKTSSSLKKHQESCNVLSVSMP